MVTSIKNIERHTKTINLTLLFRAHGVFVENILCFADYFCNQRLIRTDCAQVTGLDGGKKATFHLATKACQSDIICMFVV